MTHVKGATYISDNLKPHHRSLIAVAIIMLIFLPIIISFVINTGIKETTKVSLKTEPERLKASTLSNKSVTTKPIVATVKATVSDSVINLAPLMASYTNNQDESFGVSVVELGGKNRTGDYNGDQVFISASTYKLFTAYSTLTRIENGSWTWLDADIVDGKDLSTCFNDMIVFSDNDCAEAISTKAGHQNITDEALAIGCLDTTLVDSDGYAKTTPNDLALFLAKLYKGQILNQQSSRDILIEAMKNNVYREGIPAGLGDDIVADKVGFVDGYLNDAAIVYDLKGNYVLVIMTNNSSWDEIARLASEINLLHQQ